MQNRGWTQNCLRWDVIWCFPNCVATSCMLGPNWCSLLLPSALLEVPGLCFLSCSKPEPQASCKPHNPPEKQPHPGQWQNLWAWQNLEVAFRGSPRHCTAAANTVFWASTDDKVVHGVGVSLKIMYSEAAKNKIIQTQWALNCRGNQGKKACLYK